MMYSKGKRKSADVSVIIPVYNSGKEAYRAVKSAALQTLLPQEVILIDDCSPQNRRRNNGCKQLKGNFPHASM